MRQWALPAADTYFAPHLTEAGFQVEHLMVALRYVKSWRCAVDGGAHVGTWSVEMAKHFQQVLAFEPAADTYACLVENLRGWLNVSPLRLALGAEHTYGVVVDDPARRGNTGARFVRAGGAGDTVVKALDEYGLPDLDLLKLDVEGAELLALTGARETLARCKPVVIMEVKDFGEARFGYQAEAAPAFLSTLGAREVARSRNDRVYVFP